MDPASTSRTNEDERLWRLSLLEDDDLDAVVISDDDEADELARRLAESRAHYSEDEQEAFFDLLRKDLDIWKDAFKKHIAEVLWETARASKSMMVRAGALLLLLIVLDPDTASTVIRAVDAETATAHRARPLKLLELAVAQCDKYGDVVKGRICVYWAELARQMVAIGKNVLHTNLNGLGIHGVDNIPAIDMQYKLAPHPATAQIQQGSARNVYNECHKAIRMVDPTVREQAEIPLKMLTGETGVVYAFYGGGSRADAHIISKVVRLPRELAADDAKLEMVVAASGLEVPALVDCWPFVKVVVAGVGAKAGMHNALLKLGLGRVACLVLGQCIRQVHMALADDELLFKVLWGMAAMMRDNNQAIAALTHLAHPSPVRSYGKELCESGLRRMIVGRRTADVTDGTMDYLVGRSQQQGFAEVMEGHGLIVLAKRATPVLRMHTLDPTNTRMPSLVNFERTWKECEPSHMQVGYQQVYELLCACGVPPPEGSIPEQQEQEQEQEVAVKMEE